MTSSSGRRGEEKGKKDDSAVKRVEKKQGEGRHFISSDCQTNTQTVFFKILKKNAKSPDCRCSELFGAL